MELGCDAMLWKGSVVSDLPTAFWTDEIFM